MAIKYGLQDLWRDESAIRNPLALNQVERTEQRLKKYWDGELYRRVHKVEEKAWKRAMEKKEKLRRYRSFKTQLALEGYLLSEKEKLGRYLLTSLRVGTNKLRIETGRWKRPIEPRQERVCTQCGNGEVEDEEHFLLQCRKYQQLRVEMMQNNYTRRQTRVVDLSFDQQLQFLLRNEKKPSSVSEAVKMYVRKAMRMRIAP